MSLLPLTLFKEGVLHREISHSQQVPDLLREIFLSLPVADLEKMHLGCHQWLCVMNNIAKEAMRKQWPHLFSEYDHPRRNWIPIFCIKRRAVENIAKGCFQFIRLQFKETIIGRGIDLGKLVVMDYDKKMGILSLQGGGIYRTWQKSYDQACLGRVFGGCDQKGMRLWNLHTDKNLLCHKRGPGFLPSFYEHFMIAVDHAAKPETLWLWSHSWGIYQQLLPPQGFTQLELSIPRTPRGSMTSLISQELVFIWSALHENRIKEQVVAVYLSGAEANFLSPQYTYKLPHTFKANQPIGSVHRHEGYTLVSVDPEIEFSRTKTPGWIIFDKNNIHIEFPDRIQRVVWMPGKIVFASIEDSFAQSLHVLDTATGITGKPVEAYFLRNTQNDVSWLQAIDETHVAYLGYGESCIELFVVDVKTMQKRSFKIPGIDGEDFLQGVPVSFDGEKLIWSSARNALCVIDFTVRVPDQPRREIVEAPRNFNWKTRFVTWLRGYSRYWWIGAAIVVLGFTVYRRKFGAIGSYPTAS